MSTTLQAANIARMLCEATARAQGKPGMGMEILHYNDIYMQGSFQQLVSFFARTSFVGVRISGTALAHWNDLAAKYVNRPYVIPTELTIHYAGHKFIVDVAPEPENSNYIKFGFRDLNNLAPFPNTPEGNIAKAEHRGALLYCLLQDLIPDLEAAVLQPA